MKTFLLLATFALSFAAASGARAQTNLLPNGDFNAPDGPFSGWRIAFPYWDAYLKNQDHFKISDDHKEGSANVVEVSMPKNVAENEGAKIESAFIKADPGASYHGAVDVMTGDYAVLVEVEAWAVDPTPLTKSDLFRIPPQNGLPGLVMCYRSDFPDQPPGSKGWTAVKKDFTLPTKAIVAGKPSQPSYITMKIWARAASTSGPPVGKMYVGRALLAETKK